MAFQDLAPKRHREARLLHTIGIGLHAQFIGEIIDVKGDADVFGADGKLDIMKIKPL